MSTKTVVITGAASGIGKAIAYRFAKEGYQTFISDINEDGLQKLNKDIINKGGKSDFLKADTSNYDEVRALIKKAHLWTNKLDVLVNNAGIGPNKLLPTGDYELDDWHKVIAVNQTGVFYGMKCALQIMAEQQSGVIINIASLAGLIASPNNISYSASKFAVVGMTKSAAKEYGKSNIRINAICPGYTESALLNKLIHNNSKLEEKLKSMIPFKRFGQAKEIAAATYWLASDESRYVTGQTLTLDGGISL